MKEIKDRDERKLFKKAVKALGQEDVNLGCAKARKATSQPYSLGAWKRAGSPDGKWQTYEFTSKFLPPFKEVEGEEDGA